MKEQLTLLIELQQFDARIQELRGAMKALPEKLAPAKQDLAKLAGILQAEKDELARTEAWRREHESVLQHEEDAIKKAKAKLQSSTSTKEFAAANRELETKRRGASEREEEILKVIEAMEGSRKSIAEHESDVATLREHVEAEERTVQSKVSELEAQIASELGNRSAIADNVEPTLLARYEGTQKRRGIAVVAVVKGACQGCHIQLPPQLVNILARHDSVETCPNCQRMIYPAALFEEPAE